LFNQAIFVELFRLGQVPKSKHLGIVGAGHFINQSPIFIIPQKMAVG